MPAEITPGKRYSHTPAGVRQPSSFIPTSNLTKAPATAAAAAAAAAAAGAPASSTTNIRHLTRTWARGIRKPSPASAHPDVARPATVHPRTATARQGMARPATAHPDVARPDTTLPAMIRRDTRRTRNLRQRQATAQPLRATGPATRSPGTPQARPVTGPSGRDTLRARRPTGAGAAGPPEWR